MILIWILFFMITTLDIIVYGLYRIIKDRPTIKKCISVTAKDGARTLSQIDSLISKIDALKKGDIFILSEIENITGKLDIVNERYNRLFIEVGALKKTRPRRMKSNKAGRPKKSS